MITYLIGIKDYYKIVSKSINGKYYRLIYNLDETNYEHNIEYS